MRVGITLPSFSEDANRVLDAARAAEAAGIHGLFCFDHLWPMGHPERPALSSYPTLAAVAAVTTTIRLGTLVARVGLLPDELVIASLLGVQAVSTGRLVAGLGTGDRKSVDEHRRYGLPELGPTARLESLGRIVRRLSGAGVECWVGAGAPATNGTARATGATLNFWGAAPERIRREAADGPTSWAGPLPDAVGEAAGLLHRLDEAGSSWAVWGWPSSLDTVVGSAEQAGVRLG